MKVHLEFDIKIDEEGFKKFIQENPHLQKYAISSILINEARSSWEYNNLVCNVTVARVIVNADE